MDGVDMMPVDINNHHEIDMSKLDMDLINTLWRQDIDMGVTREDTYPFKMELELEKSKVIDESDKPPENNWRYSIDSETGEYLPMPPQQQSGSEVGIPLTPPSQASPTSEGSLSFEDCLQLLDGFNPEREHPNSGNVSQLVNADEIEQRWQDLASISELQLASPELVEGQDSTLQNTFPNTTWNNSLSSEEPNVFAFNATTNGNVNLQNATGPQLSLFDVSITHGDQQPEGGQLLTVDTQEAGQTFPTADHALMSNGSELFSPISRFDNMTISGVPPSPAGSRASSVDLTMLLLERRSPADPLPEVATPATPVPPESATGAVSPPPRNESLLMELLNSTESTDDGSSDMDSDMQDLDNMMDILEAMDDANNDDDDDDSVMDLLSDDASYNSDSDGPQGATGYDSLTTLKDKQSSRYNRGGSSPCHSDTGSASSLDSTPPQTDKIHHNHSYASSSEAGDRKGCRSSNGSRNGTSDGADRSIRHRKDEKRARQLNIPLPVDKIINLPVDNFNDLLKKYDFSNAQLQLIRDIRRRGKNKVAAQNCRKRKISAIQVVQGSVGSMQNEHDRLLKERDKVSEELGTMQDQFDDLYRQVFRNMRDRDGEPVDPDRFQLEIMEDGSVILIPRGGQSEVERGTNGKFNPN